MEPMGVEEPADNFLEKIKAACKADGALLIFDEIVSGFRLALGGGQELFGVEPDIACFGKAMANGLPISAVVGPRNIMEIFDKIFFSGTFGGETLSLAACKATIEIMEGENGIEKISTFGMKLKSGIATILKELNLDSEIGLLGHPSRSVVCFPGVSDEESLLRRTFLMQQCIKRGLLYFCSHIPCLAHDDSELNFTLDVLELALGEFAISLERDNFRDILEGEPIKSIFRKA
jgi:glutamate-1-semialdehyde 2,1-aminomutase/spore coat polysaccharide biosynthesis protein SpsF